MTMPTNRHGHLVGLCRLCLREENARLKAEMERAHAAKTKAEESEIRALAELDEQKSMTAAWCEQCKQAEAKLERVVALHHDGPGFGDPSGWCAACGDCWPCATLAAAKGE